MNVFINHSLFNPKGLAQVVRALVLVAFPLGLRFESPWVQTIHWDQPVGEVGVLPDLCRGGALHWSEVYPTGIGIRNDPALVRFLVIKKKPLTLRGLLIFLMWTGVL